MQSKQIRKEYAPKLLAAEKLHRLITEDAQSQSQGFRIEYPGLPTENQLRIDIADMKNLRNRVVAELQQLDAKIQEMQSLYTRLQALRHPVKIVTIQPKSRQGQSRKQDLKAEIAKLEAIIHDLEAQGYTIER